MVLEIIISEPWDFKSSDGDNFLKVKVLERKKSVISAKALSNYSGKEGYLVITPRSNYGDINICQKSEKGEITYCMIGKYADRYNRKQ